MIRHRPDLEHMSIRTRLVSMNLVTIGAVLLFIAILLLAAEYLAGRRALIDDANLQGEILAANTTAAVAFGDRDSATEMLQALRASPAVSEAAIYAEDGSLFAWYQRDGLRHEIAPHLPPLDGDHMFERDHFDQRGPIAVDGRQLGTLRMSVDLAPLHARLLWFGSILAAVIALGLAAGAALMNRLQRGITGPVARLAELARRVSRERNYSLRATVESRDEIGELADSVNGMLHQIQTRDSELAHELNERKLAEERLDRLAHFDTVTSLPNRYFFNERLRMAVTRAHRFGDPVALMFLDLDNFKIVNDTLGHHVGDALLHVVGQRLAEVLRTGDTISRVGGDEFAIILENLGDAVDVTVVADKCRSALAAPITIEGNSIYVTASIGISLCPQDTSDMQELLKNADAAMYHAKARGKNAHQVFLPEMQGLAQKRLVLETSLRRAIERDELLLHYQPQIDLKTRRTVAVEALVRWQHPDLGLVSPMDFIPLAEETGLIVPIGEWVLRTACVQGQAWRAAGLGDLRVAVNLSGRQFKDERLIEAVLAIVQETGLPAHLLELELTESSIMDGGPETIAKLNALRAVGIQLSIDDFGTGYSSMSYLKRFPIGMLKVDRSFVRDLPEDSEDAAITKAIIAMAHSLKLKVTAEGVENEEQAEFLAAQGCELSQGFHFSRPVVAAEISALLKRERGGAPLPLRRTPPAASG